MKKPGKLLSILIRLAVSILILVFLLRGIKDNFRDVLDNISSLNAASFILAVLVYVLVSAIGAFRFRMIMDVHDISIPFLRIWRNIYIGYLFNLFLLGSMGGDAVRSYYFAKETHRKTEIVTLVFFDRLIGVVTMMIIALSSLAFNLHDPRMRQMAVGAAIVLAACAAFFLIIMNKQALQRSALVRSVASRLAFRQTLGKIYNTLHFFKGHKARVLCAIFLSVVIQSLAIVSCYLVACSLTRIDPIPLRYFFLLMPVIFAGSALPVSIGGWGVFEMGFVVCFGLMGVPKDASFTVGLMNHLVLIILGLAGMVVYILPGTEHLASQAISVSGGVEGEDPNDNRRAS
jgi:glycosyltransferase 2 family protein